MSAQACFYNLLSGSRFVTIAGVNKWPDAIDLAIIGFGLALLLGLPLLGHWLAVLDLRAYLRSLKGMLVKATHVFPGMPSWARYHTPGCLLALGLKLPCTEDEVKTAYRSLAQIHHPDRGGDREKFTMLQTHFDNSIQFLRNQQAPESA